MNGKTHIWIKQIRGQAGKPLKQKLTLAGLGLKRVGDEMLLRDTPAIRGMIIKVQHLIAVQVRLGEIIPNGARTRGKNVKS